LDRKQDAEISDVRPEHICDPQSAVEAILDLSDVVDCQAVHKRMTQENSIEHNVS
jgi:hypothetical protein